MIPLNVLVGCECSGVVRDAFRVLGHNAWSCDLKPAALNSPLTLGYSYHLTGDVRRVLRGNIPRDMVADSGYRHTPMLIAWDLFIVHPDCRFLSVSGLHWNLRRPGRALETEKALEFVREMLAAPIPRIALENPLSCISSRIRKSDQIIQPYQFGEDASKATHLWLHNLPPLQIDPVGRVSGRLVMHNGKQVERWANQTDSGQNRLGPSDTRAADRAITYPGIARAMAQQWGRLPTLPPMPPSFAIPRSS